MSEMTKEIGVRVGDKVVTGLVTLCAVGVAFFLILGWFKKAPKTEFVTEPEPIPAGGGGGGFLPMQPPVIPPIIMPPPIKPDPVVRLSDINLLSGACATLHYNILQELEMITPGKMYGFLPKYVEPVGKRYINSAKRIVIYYKNSLKGAPGVFGCEMVWRDVVAYLNYLANNPKAGLEEPIRLSARMVWVKLRNKQVY